MSKNRGATQSRKERRMNNQVRDFSNKKGTQLNVVPYVDPVTRLIKFTKVKKVLQRLKGKTIVQYQYS